MKKLNSEDISKETFSKAWPGGYYDKIKYGVKFRKVFDTVVSPFFGLNKTALEIGCGGGTFTEDMKGNFKHLIAIDVIPCPEKFANYNNFNYIELEDQDFYCTGIENESIDFCFSYNVFCHLSNEAIIEYLHSVHRVLKDGGDFVFMLSNYKNMLPPNWKPPIEQKKGKMTHSGHFYQDETTLDGIIDNSEFEIINPNMMPEHRDIIVHLKKK